MKAAELVVECVAMWAGLLFIPISNINKTYHNKTDDRGKWRRFIFDAANPRIDDG